ELDGRFELGDGLSEVLAQEVRTAERPMAERIAWIEHQSLLREADRAALLGQPVGSELEKRALPMDERQSGIGARRTRIELDRATEVLLREVVVRRGEPIHVRAAPIVRAPRVEVRRREDGGALPLRVLDLRLHGTDDQLGHLFLHREDVAK